MEYITVKEASEKWSVIPRRLNYYCAYCAGDRIPGAVKMATIRLIPKDAEKPVDKRYKNVRKLVHERIVKMNGYKIMIVDDEPDILDLLEKALNIEGFFNITKVDNGLTAVDACKQISPDIIILDVMLPGIDGYEVCKRIRQFSHGPNTVCQGDWDSRVSAYTKFFGKIPLSEDEISTLDDLRQTRNLVGHYFGREKQKYEAPLYLEPSPVQRVSQKKLIKYFSTVYDSATKIDKHLHGNFIGSYDVIKYFYTHSECKDFADVSAGVQAKELRKMLGSLGFNLAGSEYYKNIIAYTLIEDKNDICRYTTKACIITIRRKLKELGISLQKDGVSVTFSRSYFLLFVKALSFRQNPEYCKKYTSKGRTECFYSAKAIELIISKIQANPTTIISNIQKGEIEI